MGSFTQSDYIAMLARLKGKPAAVADAGAVSRERCLHDQILNECKARRWLVVHSRMDQPTSQGLGVPDFIILADGGRMFLVEAKSRQGKLSIPQMAFGIMAESLGHKVSVVRSLANFIEVVSKP